MSAEKGAGDNQVRVQCVGMLRVRNEARWIEEVIHSILPVCHQVFVLDDHSDDRTGEICAAIGPKVLVFRSPFDTMDESRDKNWLYEKIIIAHPARETGICWPQWILAIDGDEVLDQRDLPLLEKCMSSAAVAWRQRIIYLWNDRQHYRVDGVYAAFNRPSLFRVINPEFKFQSTPWGKDPRTGEAVNFHCSSIPQELLYLAQPSEVRLNHLGYMYKEDRIRKYAFYNRIDPENLSEDCYRHIVQGDVPEVPANFRLMHAGPLTLREVS